MKRSGPLRRKTPLRSTPPPVGIAPIPGRKARLRARSRKTVAEADQRNDVRFAALVRAGWRCEATSKVPAVSCGGPLDVDEIVPRGVRPVGHLDPDNVQVLCRAHHEWKHAHPTEAAAVGLRRWSWEV